jgi:hypothetical protein
MQLILLGITYLLAAFIRLDVVPPRFWEMSCPLPNT